MENAFLWWFSKIEDGVELKLSTQCRPCWHETKLDDGRKDCDDDWKLILSQLLLMWCKHLKPDEALGLLGFCGSVKYSLTRQVAMYIASSIPPHGRMQQDHSEIWQWIHFIIDLLPDCLWLLFYLWPTMLRCYIFSLRCYRLLMLVSVTIHSLERTRSLHSSATKSDFFLSILSVDHFYTENIGYECGKLFTAEGLEFWWLVNIIHWMSEGRYETRECSVKWRIELLSYLR